MFALLPDVDAALIAFLKDHASLSPLHSGRVGHALPSGTATAIRIAGIGGVPDWPWESRSEFQVECWGGTQAQAITLARTVVAAVYDFKGPITGGHVTSTDVTLFGLDSPDAVTGRARIIVQVRVIAMPTA